MLGGDGSDYSPADGIVTEGVREGILAALAGEDLNPEDRAQLEAALKNLDAQSSPDAEPAAGTPAAPEAAAPKIIDPSAAPSEGPAPRIIVNPSE